MSAPIVTMLATPMLSIAQAEESHHPDAALIFLGDDLAKANAAEKLLLVKSQSAGAACTYDKAWGEAYEHCRDLVSKIESLPASTLEGLKVKASAYLWCHGGDIDEIDPGYEDQNTTNKRLARQILVALLIN